jgi:hypothetical protein
MTYKNTCPICKTEYEKPYKSQFCGMKCKAESMKVPTVKRYCIICNSEIELYNKNSYYYKKYCDKCHKIVHSENCRKGGLK